MADRLTSAQFAEFGERNLRSQVTRSLTLVSDSLALTDISAYARKWGDLETTTYNAHPLDRGTIDFPVVTVLLDNSGGGFNIGGTYFPGGLDDFGSMVARLQISVGGFNVLDFSGAVLQPEIDDSKMFRLVIEHPLAAIARRRWTRDDRIGGDTGQNWFFT